jgi:energy-converting hydrogenase Eha subunit A
LQARIGGDTNYKNTPLIASFDTSAVNPVQVLTFNQMMIYYLLPILALSGGIIILIIILKNIQAQKPTRSSHNFSVV